MKLDIPEGDFAGYIFDLDGTLIDSMPVHYRSWDAVLREHGLSGPLDEDYFYSLGGVPSHRVAELFARHHNLTFEPETVMHRKEQRYREMLAGVGLIEPVVAFARRVAAMRPVAIATGGTRDIALPALDAAGLRDLFPIVVTADDIPPGHGKPAPDMFLLAARLMGVRPERCLVFEDAEPGIRGARAAGMQVVHVDSRRMPRAA